MLYRPVELEEILVCFIYNYIVNFVLYIYWF